MLLLFCAVLCLCALLSLSICFRTVTTALCVRVGVRAHERWLSFMLHTYIHSASSRSRIQQRSLEFVFGASVPSLTCSHPRGGCSLLIRLSLTRSLCVSLYSIYSRALFVPASLAARLWVRVVYLFLRLWAAYCVGKSGALIFRTCTCMQTYRDMLVHV